MTRTYANFLLFEDVLDNLPDFSPVMNQAVQLLLTPTTYIVDEDCGTLLGDVRETTFELEGLTETATGSPLSYNRIVQLLGAGQYKTKIRTLNSCLSHANGGICRTCYESNFLGKIAPQVGSTITLSSLQIYQSDVLIGDNVKQTFNLSQTEDDWYDVVVVHQGLVVDPSEYTLGEDTITFNTPLPSDRTQGLHVVHFMSGNSEPFLGYIAKTYSGALLGMQPLPTLKPLLRQSLYEAQFSDSMVGIIVEEVTKLKALPTTYKDYLDRVHGKMEKVLLALYLFAIYGYVEV